MASPPRLPSWDWRFYLVCILLGAGVALIWSLPGSLVP